MAFDVSGLHEIRNIGGEKYEIQNDAKSTIASYLRNGYWDRQQAGRLLKRFVNKPVGALVLRVQLNTSNNANEYRVEALDQDGPRMPGITGSSGAADCPF